MTETASGLRAPLVVWALALAIMGTYAAFVLAPPDMQDMADYAFALIPERFHAESQYRFQQWYEYLGPIFGHAFLHAGRDESREHATVSDCMHRAHHGGDQTSTRPRPARRAGRRATPVDVGS